MQRSHSLALSCTAAAFAIAAAIITHAGPLDPPAGPVTGTLKTLADLEPRTAINAANTPGDASSLFKIVNPGSYYLTGNIVGNADKHGIVIECSGVTLDLNGFEVRGAPGVGAVDGVRVTGLGNSDVAVLNGSVHGWGGSGVDLGSFQVRNSRVEGVRASLNVKSGIRVDAGTTVSNCSAYFNGTTGITTGIACTVSGCSALSNGLNGIYVDSGSTVSNCATRDNGRNNDLSVGIESGTSCTISNSTANYNNGNGIQTSNGCAISNSTTSNNVKNGIASTGSSISNCTSSFNAGLGISIASGTVTGCSTNNNTLSGIRSFSFCLIRGNSCATNGSGSGDGAGIFVSGPGNTIENNNCGDADRGIHASIPDNIIIKNMCKGNTTNWDIAAGNVCFVVQGAVCGVIIGNAGGNPPNSTDPNANFSY